MKTKIIGLVIIVAIITVALSVRRTFDRGIGIGNNSTTVTMDDDDNLTFTDVNVGAWSLADLDVSDDIDALESSVEGVQYWTITPASSGDSLNFSDGTNSYWFSPSSGESTDNTPPAIETVEVGNINAYTMLATFDEALNEDSIPSVTAFDIVTSEGDGEAIVTNVALDGDEMELTLDTSILQGELVTYEYTRPITGRLQDAAGNLVVSLYTGVETNIESEAIIHSLLRFENDLDNEVSSGITFVQSEGGTVNYNSGGAQTIEGSYSLNADGSWHLKSTEKIPFPEEWTLTLAVYDGSSIDESPLLSIDNNVDFYVDYLSSAPTDYIYAQTYPGGTQYASSTGSNISWVLVNLAFRYRDDYLTIWKDGVNVTTDSIVGDLSAMNDTVRIAKTAGGEGYTDADAFNFYKVALTDAQIVAQHASPGEIVGGVDPPDPPDEDYTLIFSNDFDDDGLHSRGNYDPYDDPGWPRVYNSDTYPPINLAVVEFGSDTVWAHYTDDGCCGAFINDPCPCSSGTYFHAYFHSDLSGYNDVYLSYNMATSPDFHPGQDATTYPFPSWDGQEMKMPGMGSQDNTDDDCLIRLWWNNWLYKPTNTGYPSLFLNLLGVGGNQAVANENSIMENDGTWMNFTMRISTNTPGSSNGLVEIFRDGARIYSASHELVNNRVINRVTISTSFGGSGVWDQADEDRIIYFDDFVVWTTDAYARGEPSPADRILSMPPECEWPKE